MAGLRDDDEPVGFSDLRRGPTRPREMPGNGRHHGLRHYGPSAPALLTDLISERQGALLTRRKATTWPTAVA